MAHRAQSIGVEYGSTVRPSGFADLQRPRASLSGRGYEGRRTGPWPRVDAAFVLDTARYQAAFGPVSAPGRRYRRHRRLVSQQTTAGTELEAMIMNSGNRTRKILVRSRTDRMVAGVCAGVGDYFGVDVTLIRVIVAVAAVITGGVGILAYLVAWALIPAESETISVAENIAGQSQDSSAR